jgi:hypothetical protein
MHGHYSKYALPVEAAAVASKPNGKKLSNLWAVAEREEEEEEARTPRATWISVCLAMLAVDRYRRATGDDTRRDETVGRRLRDGGKGKGKGEIERVKREGGA